MAPKASTLLAALTGAAAVSAHGHVSHIIVNGVQYRNYDPTSDFYNPGTAPKVIGWSALNQDNGFIEPGNFGAAEIICHKGAKPGAGHATVAAGDKINIVWTPEWPESHVGPVIDYLADCNGPCETVNPASLRFFKIGAAGYSNGWAADALRANGNSWLVQIPSDLKPGNYVLRHEILALHGAPNVGGTQAYPQCMNIRVTGSGTRSPAGVAGTSLYRANDAGILFNTYMSPVVYPVPGPALISGVPSSVAQSRSVATTTASATLPGQDNGGSQPQPTTPPAVITTPGPVNPLPTTLSTRASATPTASAPSAEQTKWGQCGGNGYSGPTACVAGSVCNKLNDYYSQCI
ncbi:polysaccharide monooxygenase [Podospora conica]|nr:polysaccharide monooxygenase [Schizothecium conicum]